MTIRFDSSVAKRNKKGAVVLSDTLEKGEKLLTGESYNAVKKRMGLETSGVPAEAPETAEPSDALTLTEDGISTTRASAPETAPAEIAPVEPNAIATVSDDGDSTKVVPAKDETAQKTTAKKTTAKKSTAKK